VDQLLPEKNTGKTPSNAKKPRVLVAPLDWGLGHATRCIPIIRELIDQNCDVWLAGEGDQKELLLAEFPELPFLELQGYRIKYSKTKAGLLWKILRQIPRINRSIRNEHEWLKKMVAENNIDAVISDNRYGLYHNKIPSIFITHQLRIKSNAGNWSENILQRKNYKHIGHFNECWIPDLPGNDNLAQDLSHPKKLPATPVKYIGPLSRFTDKNAEEKKDHLLIIISGPEPQRRIFENQVINEIGTYGGTAVIVRGLPSSSSIIPSGNSIRVFNHLPAAELNAAMNQAEFVIARSGYSTVMDLVSLKKKSILVPTPGQTEQEYLARSLQEKNIACSFSQSVFSLKTALPFAREFRYHFPEYDTSSLLRSAITDWLGRLHS